MMNGRAEQIRVPGDHLVALLRTVELGRVDAMPVWLDYALQPTIDEGLITEPPYSLTSSGSDMLASLSRSYPPPRWMWGDPDGDREDMLHRLTEAGGQLLLSDLLRDNALDMGTDVPVIDALIDDCVVELCDPMSGGSFSSVPMPVRYPERYTVTLTDRSA